MLNPASGPVKQLKQFHGFFSLEMDFQKNEVFAAMRKECGRCQNPDGVVCVNPNKNITKSNWEVMKKVFLGMTA